MVQIQNGDLHSGNPSRNRLLRYRHWAIRCFCRAGYDERFRNNPLVTSEPKIRFYAGAPLINEEGYALGTICVIDRTPRQLDSGQQAALKALSRQVLAQMEFRRNLILLKEALIDRTKEEHERQQELLKLQQTLLRVLGLRGSKP